MTGRLQGPASYGLTLVMAGRYERSSPEAASSMSWLRRFKRAVEDAAPDVFIGARFSQSGEGPSVLRVRLHPAAGDVVVTAPGDGRVVVTAETAAVGPGYHRYLARLMRRLAPKLDVRWASVAEGSQDPTGFWQTGSDEDVEGAMTAWLQKAARQALEARRRGAGSVALSLRFGHAFDGSEAALITPMGPRDEDWLEAVARDGGAGVDVFAWWDEALDARTKLGRALSMMWTEVVWRPPLLAEEWRRLREVTGLLKAAYREAPGLRYPWPEWKELLGYLGQAGTLADEVRERASQGEPRAPIGYRRRQVQVFLPEGWSFAVDGSFAERREWDGSWVAGDHRRSVRLVPLDSAEAHGPLEVGGVPLEHRRGSLTSRGTLHTVGESEHRLTAVCDSPSAKALCVITFDDAADAPWAERTWRSIEWGR